MFPILPLPLGHDQTCLTATVCISFVLVIAVYVIYWKGPVLRKRSPFAQQLSESKVENNGRRLSQVHSGSKLGSRPTSRANSFARLQQDLRVREALGSRQNSYAAPKLAGSRGNSVVGH